jgi:hypothetical protein
MYSPPRAHRDATRRHVPASVTRGIGSGRLMLYSWKKPEIAMHHQDYELAETVMQELRDLRHRGSATADEDRPLQIRSAAPWMS